MLFGYLYICFGKMSIQALSFLIKILTNVEVERIQQTPKKFTTQLKNETFPIVLKPQVPDPEQSLCGRGSSHVLTGSTWTLAGARSFLLISLSDTLDNFSGLNWDKYSLLLTKIIFPWVNLPFYDLLSTWKTILVLGLNPDSTLSHSVAWTSHLSTLSFSFLIYRMGTEIALLRINWAILM